MKGPETRAKMITKAAMLIQAKGYNGTGLNEVLKSSSTPKGSLYFHFPGGKTELISEAILYAGERVRELLESSRKGTTAESLDCYLKKVTRRLSKSGFVEGCPISTVALEVAATEQEVAAACNEALSAIVGVVSGWLQSDGFKRDEADERAMLIYSAISGSFMFSKAFGNTEPLQGLVSNLNLLCSIERRAYDHVVSKTGSQK